MAHDVFGLIAALVGEAMQMTGDEAKDMILIGRGAVWVKEFQTAYPIFASFVNDFLMGSPASAWQSLAAWQPSVKDWSPQQKQLAIQFIEGLQKKVRGS